MIRFVEGARRATLIVLLGHLAGTLALHGQELRPTYLELTRVDGEHLGAHQSPDARFVLMRKGSGTDGSLLLDRQQGTTTPSTEDFLEAHWSPDGNSITYARLDEEGSKLFIWRAPVDPASGLLAGAPRRVSLRPGRGPAFSPDGRSIAFAAIPATDTASPRVVVIPAGGGPERVVVTKPGFARGVTWSPDGRWIYYLWASGRGGFIERVSAAGGEPETLKEALELVGLSPDGRFLAYVPRDPGNEEEGTLVGIATADGVDVGRFRTPPNFWPEEWSARGSALLAVQNLTATEVHLAPLAGGPTRRVGGGAAASWSRDGRLAFLAQLDGGERRIVVADARGGMPKPLPSEVPPDPGHPPVSPGLPLWSPDGRYLAFTSGSRRSLRVVEVATGISAEIARGEGIDWVAWLSDSRSLYYRVFPPAVAGGPRTGSVDGNLAARQGAARAVSFHKVTVGGLDQELAPFRADLVQAPDRLTLASDTLVLVRTESGVFALHPETGEVRTLYTRQPDDDQDDHYPGGVAASPDGRWVAFPATSVERVEGSGDRIRLVSLAGEPMQTIRWGPLMYGGPFRWHPDGRHLMVYGVIRQDTRAEDWLIPLDGGPMRPTSASIPTDFWDPRLSPDGSMLAYTISARLHSAVFEIELARALALFTLRGGP